MMDIADESTKSQKLEQFLLHSYRSIFCRKRFYRFNHHLQRISLRGIGIFNWEGNRVSGEQYLLSKLRDKDIGTVVDVGANVGWYVLDIHRYLPDAEIYAVEPHPRTFELLRDNTRGIRVHMFNIGLGDRTEDGTLWDFADDSPMKHGEPIAYFASTLKGVIDELHRQNAQAFTVPMTTLDRFAEAEDISIIDLLKIDTEGTEIDVLKGAKNLLKMKKVRFIQFEFNEMNVYNRTFFRDFIDLLPGYSFYRLMPSGFYQLGPYRPSTHEIFAFQNILAVPDGEEM
jgi:FkbM family methyltransferase